LHRLLSQDLTHIDSAAPFDYQRELEQLINTASDLALGPTTQSIVDEAAKRGIPALRLNDQSLVQLSYGKYQKHIVASTTPLTSNIAVEMASDKELTVRLLADVGLPVPRNILVSSVEEALSAAERLEFPLVTKPLDVSHGRGVSLNLNTLDEVRWGYEQAANYTKWVLVEQFLAGKDYRILVINDKVVAAAERVPAHVIGDGKHTIAQLVEIVNRDPRRGLGHEKVLTQITINSQAERLLQQAGYTLETILPAGQVFHLRSTANISTGGTAIDRTGENRLRKSRDRTPRRARHRPRHRRYRHHRARYLAAVERNRRRHRRSERRAWFPHASAADGRPGPQRRKTGDRHAVPGAAAGAHPGDRDHRDEWEDDDVPNGCAHVEAGRQGRWPNDY
jgi:cyanophycin synthetase